MGEFNSGDHYIYYYWQESLGRNGIVLIVKKNSLKRNFCLQSQKWQNDLGSFPRWTIQHHSNPSLYPIYLSVCHSKCYLRTAQGISLHMDITSWSVLQSDWLYPLQLNVEKPYTVSKNKTWNWLWLRSSAPYYKIQAQIEKKKKKRKKTWKTTRPFKYDLNQISYDYTMEL